MNRYKRKKRKFNTERLLRQEAYLTRAYSVASTLFFLACLPYILMSIALFLSMLTDLICPSTNTFFLDRLADTVDLIRTRHPLSTVFTLLLFAWFHECRLKLQHIETIKTLKSMESSQHHPAPYPEQRKSAVQER
jgi:hypothetical protein